MKLTLLPGRLAVCRLEPASSAPQWATGSDGFYSVTRTADELSVVCGEDRIPPGVSCERGWRIFKVEGPLDFGLTGILLSIARPLAEASVSIFAIATFDTDYVMVKEHDLASSTLALEAAGHSIHPAA